VEAESHKASMFQAVVWLNVADEQEAMKHSTRASLHTTSALLAVAGTVALAIGVFIAEVISPLKLAVSVFYVVVVLFAARFFSPRRVALVGAGCVALTVLSYSLGGLDGIAVAGIRLPMSVAVIVLSSFLAIEQKRAMAAMRRSEAQWKEVFEHNPVMYFMISPVGTILSVNKFGATQLGYVATELVGKSVLEIFLKRDQEFVKEQLTACFGELGRSHSWEIQKHRKDGTILWVRENAKAVRRAANDVVVLIACEDITERRRGEQRVAAQYAVTRILAEAESLAAAAPHLLREIGEHLEWDWGALWNFDRKRDGEDAPLHCDILWRARDIEPTEFDTVSREWTVTTSEGLVGRVWRTGRPIWIADAATEREFLRAGAAAKAGLHGGVLFPILLDTEVFGVAEFFSRAARRRDEEQFATMRALGSQIGQFIKRQRAEAALRASEEQWRAMFETTAVGIATSDLQLRYKTANQSFQQMTGYSEEELRNLTPMDITHEDDQTAMLERIDEFIAGSRRGHRVEKRLRRKGGKILWAEINTFFVPATEGTPAFLGGMVVDITDRKRAEAGLRASEERWRTVFETAAVGIVMHSSDQPFASVNPAFQTMVGYTEDELRKMPMLDLTHEDDRATTREFYKRVFAGERRSFRIEKRYRRKDGATVWADTLNIVIPATDSTPAMIAAMVVDITERKQAEAALQQAQADLARLNRVMLLGELTASIAHEINQPIAAVITNANAGLRWLGARQPDVGEARQALSRIVRDGTRAGDVIGRIRALAKKLPPQRDRMNLNEAIREVIALTENEMHRNNVRLESQLVPDLPLVVADRVQLQQVMINLIVNAIEAMAGAGGQPRELLVASGGGIADEVFVEVADTGPGLDAKQLDRLFQSFYTTKPEGIGMGLAISRSIAEAHSGRLSAAPNQPRGAIFRLTLPVESTLSGSPEPPR
jgi:PAS domain S-box-containing protein